MRLVCDNVDSMAKKKYIRMDDDNILFLFKINNRDHSQLKIGPNHRHNLL